LYLSRGIEDFLFVGVQQSSFKIKKKGIDAFICLQEVARMCFEKAEISPLLGKVRALLCAFKRNLDDETTLRIQDQEFHVSIPESD